MESSTLDVQRALLARTQVQIMAADCLHRFCTEKSYFSETFGVRKIKIKINCLEAKSQEVMLRTLVNLYSQFQSQYAGMYQGHFNTSVSCLGCCRRLAVLKVSDITTDNVSFEIAAAAVHTL